MDNPMSKYTFEKRQEVSAKLLEKFSDRIPVIVMRAPRSTLPQIDRSKYIISRDTTMCRFCYEIRKHIPELRPEQSIFTFIANKHMATSTSLIGDMYDKYHDDDGFLYITYTGENTFGAVQD